MATFRFGPQASALSYDWGSPTTWMPEQVPNASDADVFVDPADTVLGVPVSPEVEIAPGENFTVRSLEIGGGAGLSDGGSLTVGSGLVVAGDYDQSGALSAGEVETEAGSILTMSGTTAVSGAFLNAGSLSGAAAIVTAEFRNTGTIQVDAGGLSITTAAGRFDNLVGGVLTGGTYIAGSTSYQSSSGSATIALNVGDTIRTDAANITVAPLAGFDITTVDPATGRTVGIETTLTDIATNGTLHLTASTIWHTSLTVDGNLVLSDNFDAPSLDVAPGGSVVAIDTSLDGPVTNDGLISVQSQLVVGFYGAPLTGTGTIVLTGATAPDTGMPGVHQTGSELYAGANISNEIDLETAASIIDLAVPTAAIGRIEGFAGPIEAVANGESLTAPGDEIIIQGLSRSAIDAVTYVGDAAGGTLSLSASGQDHSFDFIGDYDLGDFDVTGLTDQDGIEDTVITDDVVACFVTGTRIETEHGEIAVETIRPGMRLRLLGGGLSPVVWTGHRRLARAEPIRIGAGALGDGLPRRNLVVSPDHALFLDGVLVPAGLLVDGAAIAPEPCGAVTYHHVELETHGVLLAEGAPAESYFDSGNRRQFGNCPIGYDPAAAIVDPVADIVVGGPRLRAIRTRLAALPVLTG